MKILFATSEAVPFCKTGGLADVAGSLPQALAQAGNEVEVILPLYQRVADKWKDQMEFICHIEVPLGWRRVYCGLFRLEKDGVIWYFVDNEYYFKRDALYGHYDDGERYGFFSRSIISLLPALQFMPEVIHCNDWQTALVPIYLKDECVRWSEIRGIKTVFTIHNIEYQGRYGKETLEDLFGLAPGWFADGTIAMDGDVNLLKGALMTCDAITAVSPTYAQELRYSFFAHGMESVIQRNAGKVYGVLNGLDMERYDPSKGKGIKAKFSVKDMSGKAKDKAWLQEQMSLTVDPEVPVIGIVSRLVSHKGFDLVVDAVGDIMATGAQMVVLGTGDWQYEEAFRHAQGQYPGRFSAQLTYSAPLSNMIYAGADIFLMPSVSEPCGLSQMIAMRFGTIPVVRETGGLKDSVTPYNKYEGTGRGFTFANISAGDMVWVLREAVDLYNDDKKAWKGLQKEGMTADFSWKNSAQQYLDIYNRILG